MYKLSLDRSPKSNTSKTKPGFSGGLILRIVHSAFWIPFDSTSTVVGVLSLLNVLTSFRRPSKHKKIDHVSHFMSDI